MTEAAEVPIPAPYLAHAARFPPSVRSLIVDGVNPDTVSVSGLLNDLKWNPDDHLITKQAEVLHAPAVLDAESCATLRRAVDNDRSLKRDSTDGEPEHELPLTRQSLAALIGTAAADALCSLPAQFTKGDSAGVFHPHDIFVRRYCPTTRPWIPFHADAATVTVNVALCADGEHDGGQLVAVVNGSIVRIGRGEGDATVHDSRLLHAVTRTRRGVRYSMILFFGRRARDSPNGGASTPQPKRGAASEARTALRSAADAVDACIADAEANGARGSADAAAAFDAMVEEAQGLIDTLILARQRVIHTNACTTLHHINSSLGAGSMVQLRGLSTAALNGSIGTVAHDTLAWTGERYKVDVRGGASGASVSRILIRPRNLRAAIATCTGEGSTPRGASSSAAVDISSDGSEHPACDVRLRLHPPMLPSIEDIVRWRALREIGYREAGGRDAPLASMETFELSAADWHAYRSTIGTAGGTMGGGTGGGVDGSPSPPDPPSLTLLTLFIALLVCPAATLEHFIEHGTMPKHGVLVEGGVLGRALVALIDSNLELGEGGEGGEGGGPPRSSVGGGADSARRQLGRWREALCHRYGLPPDGPSPHACWTCTILRASCLPLAQRLPTEPDAAAVAARASRALRSSAANGVHIETAWLPPSALSAVRVAAADHMHAHRQSAGVGPSDLLAPGSKTDIRIRRCDAADLLAPGGWHTLHPILCDLVRALDRLRVELGSARGRTLLDGAEMQLLHYPVGGHYRRHLDNARGASGNTRREISFLVYLTPDEWDSTSDGGQLRTYRVGSGAEGSADEAVADVAPTAGTLVCFESTAVPHEVLRTNRERLALVGWFYSQEA